MMPLIDDHQGEIGGVFDVDKLFSSDGDWDPSKDPSDQKVLKQKQEWVNKLVDEQLKYDSSKHQRFSEYLLPFFNSEKICFQSDNPFETIEIHKRRNIEESEKLREAKYRSAPKITYTMELDE